MTSWSVESGNLKELLGKIAELINSPNTKILEARLEREMLDIYDGLGLVETSPTGVMRVEIRFHHQRNKEGKDG